MASQNSGLTEDEFIRKLIAAVEKRPVLYDVHLFDYKNKNKKGENFKEIQQELRDAGASEQQVQFIYKKWISIKRKFRVEFFKLQSEDNGKEATCAYPYYESLKFLIPYCQYYK
uniref:MADF domain-containing protein n=1 Tax=Acrobeloides nanus TaxID=290746 RepID=A0A914EII4_9BILA